MNKKNKWIVVLCFVFVAALLAWLLWPQSDRLSAEADAQLSQVEQLGKLAEEAKNDPEKNQSLLEALYEKLSPKQRHQYRLGFESGMEDIGFYGQVVDQHGEPVVGATFEWEGGGALLAPGAGKARHITDHEGKFNIHVRGGSLIIRNIEHPTIKFLFDNHSYGSKGNITFWGYQRMEGGNEPLWTDYPRENPYIFRAWRMDSADLVPSLNTNRDNFRADCEGNAYTINMVAPFRTGKRLIKGEAEGQLRVRFLCTEAQTTQTADWSAEIEVIDGGLLETTDLYMYKAPESGYSPSYKSVISSTDREYIGGVANKKFYFYSNHGREYGSLAVTFRVFKGGPIIRINYTINPNGDLSLLAPNTQ